MPLSAFRSAKPKERGRSAGSPGPPTVPQLCRAAGRGGCARGAGLGSRVRLPRAGRLPAEGDLHPPAARPGLPGHTGVVATASAGARRPDHGGGDQVPARRRRALAGRRLQDARGTHPRPAPRGRPGRPGHADLRRRPRAGDATHPARRRPGPGVPAAGQARCAGAGPVGAGVRGKFRRHQHFAGIAHCRRVPAHGGVRPGRPDAGGGPGTGPAGRGRREPGLYRPGRLDRAGHVFPGHPGPAAFQPPRRGRIRLGRGRRRRRPVHRLGHPLARHAACIPTPNDSRCCCSRWPDWPSPGWRSATPKRPARAPATCCSPVSPRWAR